MARPVTGFLSDDDTFFHTEAEALMHDAEMDIRAFCVSHIPTPLDDNRLLEVIEALADPIERYLNAKAQAEVEEARKHATNLVGGIDRNPSTTWGGRHSEMPGTEVDQAHNGNAEEELASLLEQPSDGHEPVSDMGGSPPSESVLNERESYGIGGRFGNARSIRSGESVAVVNEAEAS